MQNGGDGNGSGRGTAVITRTKTRTKKPSLYRVLILNDDYTPMEFVVEILEQIFGMDRELAVRVMLKVHTEGKGVCGVFTKEVAETKAEQVNQAAREREHPLLCQIEPADDPNQ